MTTDTGDWVGPCLEFSDEAGVEWQRLLRRLPRNFLRACNTGYDPHKPYAQLARWAKRLVFQWTSGPALTGREWDPNEETWITCVYDASQDFAWIVELNDGPFVAVWAGHDNSGWGCQDHFEVVGIAETAEKAARFLPDDPRRNFEETR